MVHLYNFSSFFRKHCIVNEKQWDFLKDLTAKIPDICVEGDNKEEGSASKRGRCVYACVCVCVCVCVYFYFCGKNCGNCSFKRNLTGLIRVIQ